MTGATIGVIATLCIYRLLIGVAVAWAGKPGNSYVRGPPVHQLNLG